MQSSQSVSIGTLHIGAEVQLANPNDVVPKADACAADSCLQRIVQGPPFTLTHKHLGGSEDTVLFDKVVNETASVQVGHTVQTPGIDRTPSSALPVSAMQEEVQAPPQSANLSWGYLAIGAGAGLALGAAGAWLLLRRRSGG